MSAPHARIWPPAEWCAAINPERTHICDQPRGHDGDHKGPELPTVEIDEPTSVTPPGGSDAPQADGPSW